MTEFSVYKIKVIYQLWNIVWLQFVFRHIWDTNGYPYFNYFVLLRITDEGSVPEMRIWSIL